MARYIITYSQPIWERYTFTAEIPDNISEENSRYYIIDNYKNLSENATDLFIDRSQIINVDDCELEIEKSN